LSPVLAAGEIYGFNVHPCTSLLQEALHSTIRLGHNRQLSFIAFTKYINLIRAPGSSRPMLPGGALFYLHICMSRTRMFLLLTPCATCL
jgi:hypothetical protein